MPIVRESQIRFVNSRSNTIARSYRSRTLQPGRCLQRNKKDYLDLVLGEEAEPLEKEGGEAGEEEGGLVEQEGDDGGELELGEVGDQELHASFPERRRHGVSRESRDMA